MIRNQTSREKIASRERLVVSKASHKGACYGSVLLMSAVLQPSSNYNSTTVRLLVRLPLLGLLPLLTDECVPMNECRKQSFIATYACVQKAVIHMKRSPDLKKPMRVYLSKYYMHEW